MKQRKKRMKENRNIAIASYLCLIIFVALIGNLIYFLARDNSVILSNAYNSKRQDLLAQGTVKGSILSEDGQVLAETITDKKGNEHRFYPYKNMYAHAVGYVDNGKMGVERDYNYYMLRCNSNPLITALNEIKGVKNKGDNIVTNLNSKVQKAAYDALGNRKGAVIALNPDNGKILAMVSRPDYDPNTISKDWKSLIEDKYDESRLLNRATQGLYPPGSTFKLVTLLEYIRENGGGDAFSYKCSGKDVINGTTIKCYKSKKHGEEDIKKAFAKSCNCAFANIGASLNLDQMNSFARTLLFNEDIDYQFEYKKSSFNLSSKSDNGEVVQTVIGQGKTMISPLHNALLAGMIANGGYLVTPSLVDRVETAEDKRVVRRFKQKEKVNVLTENQVRIASECMKETVKSGTATSLAGKKYEAAGKTGSAEFDKSGASHAWFIGYAEYEGKKIAVSIIVEGAGTGSDYAVPVAGKIFDAYY